MKRQFGWRKSMMARGAVGHGDNFDGMPESSVVHQQATRVKLRVVWMRPTNRRTGELVMLRFLPA